MPITGPSSYLPTTDEFIAHWTAVNQTLVGPGLPPPGGWPVLALAGNRVLIGLQALRTNLAVARTDVELKLNMKEIARADVMIKRETLLARCAQFGDNLRAHWAGTPQEAALRPLARVSDGYAKVETTLDDVTTLWSLVNSAAAPPGVTLPLTLPPLSNATTPVPPPYTQGNLVFDSGMLKAAHTTLKNTEVGLDSARGVREALEAQINDYLPAYREAVAARLPADHPLQASLPRYSPLPGSTPEPATANGTWNSVTGMADIAFIPSTSTSVVRYELRYVAGPDYNSEDESTAGTIAAGSPSVFHTLAGLPAPGTTASYRVYAITADGNERSSNTVVINRP